jgi:hypothetical protein
LASPIDEHIGTLRERLGLADRRAQAHRVALAFENQAQTPADVFFVVDHEDAPLGHL